MRIAKPQSMLGDALLTKVTTTSGGAIYGDVTVSSPLGISGVMVEPAGGSAGQVIRKTENGYEWASLEQVSIDIDDTLDSSSVNPVQNKAVWSALDGKAAASHSHAQTDITGLSAALGSKADSTQITALNNAIGSKADASHTHAQADVSGLAAALGSKADTTHSHSIAQVSGLSAAIGSKLDATELTGITNAINSKADAVHSHAMSEVNGLAAALGSKADATDITSLTNAIGSKANEVHGHAIADVSGLSEAIGSKLDATELTGLTNAIGSKADSVHSHAMAEVSGLAAALGSKSDNGHQHAIADVSSLSAALGSKSDKGHTHSAADITGLVPETRTINGMAMSSNVTVTAIDIPMSNAVNAESIAATISALSSASGQEWFTSNFEIIDSFSDMQAAFLIARYNNMAMAMEAAPSSYTQHDLLELYYGYGAPYTYPKIFFMDNSTEGEGTHFYKASYNSVQANPAFEIHLNFQNELDHHEETIYMAPAGAGYFNKINGVYTLVTPFKVVNGTFDIEYSALSYIIWSYPAKNGSTILYATVREIENDSYTYKSRSLKYNSSNNTYTEAQSWYDDPTDDTRPTNVFYANSAQPNPHEVFNSKTNRATPVIETARFAHYYNPIEIIDHTTVNGDGKMRYIDLTAEHAISMSNVTGLSNVLSSFILSPSGGSSGNVLAKTSDSYAWISIPEAVTVDSTLSDASVNPVQNQVIYSALESKSNDGHMHAMADISSLSNALGSKAASDHKHPQADISGLANALGSKANTVHSHSIAQVSGLSDALGSKADSTTITELNDAIGSKITMPTNGNSGYYLKKTGATTVTWQAFDTSLSQTSINGVRNSAVYAKTSALEARISAVETQLDGLETTLSNI